MSDRTRECFLCGDHLDVGDPCEPLGVVKAMEAAGWMIFIARPDARWGRTGHVCYACRRTWDEHSKSWPKRRRQQAPPPPPPPRPEPQPVTLSQAGGIPIGGFAWPPPLEPAAPRLPLPAAPARLVLSEAPSRGRQLLLPARTVVDAELEPET